MLIDNTPWETYDIYYGSTAYPVHVKREDLCCGGDRNSPSFSKMRGVITHMESLKDDKGEYPTIGVLDTYHSKAGRGVAWICNRLKIKCIVFFPVYASDIYDDAPEYGRVYHYAPQCDIREHQRVANRMGAYLVPLQAGRSSIMYHAAKKILDEVTDGKGYMMPNALKLAESIDATAAEVSVYTPKELMHGTWVISASSGTIASGVLRGVCYSHSGNAPTLIVHMGYTRSKVYLRDYMHEMAGVVDGDIKLHLIDEGYQYKDKVDNDWIPFPCNEYYDAKAFTWLADHIPELEPPVVFWNIGD